MTLTLYLDSTRVRTGVDISIALDYLSRRFEHGFGDTAPCDEGRPIVGAILDAHMKSLGHFRLDPNGGAQ